MQIFVLGEFFIRYCIRFEWHSTNRHTPPEWKRWTNFTNGCHSTKKKTGETAYDRIDWRIGQKKYAMIRAKNQQRLRSSWVPTTEHSRNSKTKARPQQMQARKIRQTFSIMLMFGIVLNCARFPMPFARICFRVAVIWNSTTGRLQWFGKWKWTDKAGLFTPTCFIFLWNH